MSVDVKDPKVRRDYVCWCIGAGYSTAEMRTELVIGYKMNKSAANALIKSVRKEFNVVRCHNCGEWKYKGLICEKCETYKKGN